MPELKTACGRHEECPVFEMLVKMDRALRGDQENGDKLGVFAKVKILWEQRKWQIGLMTAFVLLLIGNLLK
jgi:hypothetical protein